jgi:hypothetical protein
MFFYRCETWPLILKEKTDCVWEQGAQEDGKKFITSIFIICDEVKNDETDGVCNNVRNGKGKVIPVLFF